MAKSNKLRKFFIIFILVILVLGLGSGAILWNASYSDGSRTGRIIKLSNKGILFKTWEGELNMESLGHSKSTQGQGLSTVWEFSVDASEEDVLRQLDSAMVNNLKVQVLYSEKFMLIKLRGETKYFITEVKFTDAPSDAQKSALEKQLNPETQTDSLAEMNSDTALISTVEEAQTDPESTTKAEMAVNFEMENNGCYAPCEIQFQNLSKNAVAYFWDFGDGDKSDESNPSHTFLTAGNYEVRLKAIRKDGSKTQKSKWVVVR